MSIVQILELRPAGTELFQDSESFLNELSVQEMEIMGGGGGLVITSAINSNIVSQASVSLGVSLNSLSAVSAFNLPKLP